MKNEFDIFWTQAEVAKRWKCTEGTVKNYRDRGLLSCFQPGSLVRYRKEDITKFERQYTLHSKGGDNYKQVKLIKKEMPVVSSTNDNDWKV